MEVEREVESVTDAFETDDAASERMKEIWARTLGWERYGEQLLVGGEENELVSLRFRSIHSRFYPVFGVKRELKQR